MSAADALYALLGPGKVLTDEAALRDRRHDRWALSELDDLAGRAAPSPACVVRAAELGDVVAVVNECRRTRTPLVPFGLGSGVCGGVLTSPGSVVLDLSGMRRVVEVDPTNLLATFEGGVRGSDAESTLEAHGLTLGHYPQSIGVSSVGGWVATRAAGQFSTAYGNVEDVVLALQAVLPDGTVIETRRTPRASSGPDLRHLLLGSEGTLGVVTEVTFSVRRVPEERMGAAYLVPTMAAGFDLQREIVQRGHLPAVLRQYDAIETGRMFSAWARGDAALLLVVHEGPRERVEAERSGVARVAAASGATEIDSAPTSHWLAERNHVPTFHSFLVNGIVLDTIEIAAPFSQILAIYERATSALGSVPGILAASAHSSHAYRSGVNLYFTFAAQPASRDAMRDTYLECWDRVMEATLAHGGGIAHHHGIGRVRRGWLERELGAGGLAALRAVKRALDPTGFMNPGVLLPDG